MVANPVIPKNIRRQAKMIYVWYPKNRKDMNTIHEENDVIKTEELVNVKAQLNWGKHTCLIMRMEHPRELMKFVEFYNWTVTRLLSALLSTDYSTLIKRLQHSYQDYSTPVKRL